ncbi:MAG: hypothetical protein WAV13_14630 [Thermodesulfovibrionales bacterium]
MASSVFLFRRGTIFDETWREAGIAEKIADILRKDARAEVVIVDETIPNPTDQNAVLKRRKYA